MQCRLWLLFFCASTGVGCESAAVVDTRIAPPTADATNVDDWFIRISGGSISQLVQSGAIDADGTVYLAGSLARDYTAAFLTKFDRRGSLQWQQIIDAQEGIFEDYSWSVVCDSQGQVYLGSSYASPRPIKVYIDYHLRVNQFDAAGRPGWELRGATGPFRNPQKMSGLAVDDQDNLYSATSFEDLDNYLITAYERAGQKRFEQYYPTTLGVMSFNSISSRPGGGIYANYSVKTTQNSIPIVETIDAQGTSTATVSLPSSPYLRPAPFVVHDGFVTLTRQDQQAMFQKYDVTGAVVWTSAAIDPALSDFGAFAEDVSGNIYYATWSIAENLIDVTLSLLKLSSAGDLQWTQQKHTTHVMMPRIILVDPLGQQVWAVGDVGSGRKPQYPASDPRSNGFWETFLLRFDNR